MTRAYVRWCARVVLHIFKRCYRDTDLTGRPSQITVWVATLVPFAMQSVMYCIVWSFPRGIFLKRYRDTVATAVTMFNDLCVKKGSGQALTFYKHTVKGMLDLGQL